MLNLAALAFLDARCARMIADAARAMAASRPVTVRCRPEIAAMLGRLGLTTVTGIEMVTADEH